MSSFSKADSLADALIAARRACKRIDGFPGDVPATLDEAYAVQHCAIPKWPAPLVGFKVGGVPAHFRAQYPSPWQVGPAFADQLYHVASGDRLEVSVFEGGFAAYEAELVFTLGDLSGLTAPVETLEDAASFVTAISLGAEIASSPNPQVNALGPGSIISDFGNNAGVVIGPDAPLSLLGDVSALEVTLHIDGEEIGRSSPSADETGPLGALRHLLNHLHAHRGELDIPEGCLVSSGAITGVHQSVVGTTARLSFGDHATYELAMVPRRP